MMRPVNEPERLFKRLDRQELGQNKAISMGKTAGKALEVIGEAYNQEER